MSLFPTRFQSLNPPKNRKNQVRWMRRMKAQVREGRRLRHLIPSYVRDSICILIAAVFFTYVSAIVAKIWKEWSLAKVDWFLNPSYKVPMERQWYLFFGGWKLFNLLTIYGWAKTAALVSDTLFLSLFVVFGLMVIDNVMFWWNFNDYFYIYLDLFWTMCVLIYRCVIQYQPEALGRIKSLF